MRTPQLNELPKKAKKPPRSNHSFQARIEPMKAKKTKTPKIPKAGSWKRILWELERQDVFGTKNDCYTVYGDYTKNSISAFKDRWNFIVVPFVERGVRVFRKDKRLTEVFRFEFRINHDPYLALRLYKENGYLFFSHRAWWDKRYLDIRYTAVSEFNNTDYFYMDRVI
jgi:hypothetical protein